jgi:hypothetical protein
MDLAGALAARDPEPARRMFAALSAPLAVRALEDDRVIARATLTRALDFKGLCRDAVGRLEPHVPWNQAFLSLRVDCYEASGDPRRDIARRELLDFLSREPLPLATGISR